MSLISIPREIWQDILVIWVDDLSAIVRADCAFSATAVNPLLPIYTKAAFGFLHDVFEVSTFTLQKLYTWMKDKNVYMSGLAISMKVQPLAPLWEGMLSWSGAAIREFIVTDGVTNSSSIVLSWAATYLRNLKILRLNLFHRTDPPTYIENLLRNNCDTLETLICDGMIGRYYTWQKQFPRLRTMRWALWQDSNLAAFLRLCPSLTALSIRFPTGFDILDNPTLLITAIAECCQLLQRLQLKCADLHTEALMQIATGCPLLEYLGIRTYPNAVANHYADVVCALPHLHTLVLSTAAESMLMEIAARSHASLQVLDVWTEFTPTGLRQITAALPQLTSFRIDNILHPTGVSGDDLFEHCGNLENLVLNGCRMVILNSVALHCHKLRALIIHNLDAHKDCNLSVVITNCPLLRTLGKAQRASVTLPAGYNNVQIVDKYVSLGEWMPEWPEQHLL